MPDPIDTPVIDPVPVRTQIGAKACGFCGTRLAANGDPLALGEEAKRYQKLEAANEKLTAKVAELEAKLNPAAGDPVPVTRKPFKLFKRKEV